MEIRERLDAALAGEPTAEEALAIISEVLPHLGHSRISAMIDSEGGSNNLSRLLAGRMPALATHPRAATVGISSASAVADSLICAASIGRPHAHGSVRLWLGNARQLLQ